MHINLGLNEFFCGVICQFNWGTHLKSYHFCFFFLLLTCIYSFSQHNSSASKACFAAAILFTLERKELLTALPRNLLFFGVVVFFVYVKLMSIFFKSFDPFVPFENLNAAIFFGGILDALRKAGSSKPAVAKSKELNSDASKMTPSDSEGKKTN